MPGAPIVLIFFDQLRSDAGGANLAALAAQFVIDGIERAFH